MILTFSTLLIQNNLHPVIHKYLQIIFPKILTVYGQQPHIFDAINIYINNYCQNNDLSNLAGQR